MLSIQNIYCHIRERNNDKYINAFNDTISTKNHEHNEKANSVRYLCKDNGLFFREKMKIYLPFFCLPLQ